MIFHWQRVKPESQRLGLRQLTVVEQLPVAWAALAVTVTVVVVSVSVEAATLHWRHLAGREALPLCLLQAARVGGTLTHTCAG